MQEIKKIGVMSVAKIALLFGVLIGLVMGVLMAIITNYLPAEALSLIPASYTSMSGWTALIITPITYGVIYFISGILGALIYNLFASWIGGIKVELKSK